MTNDLLTERLQAVLNYVSVSDHVADIGADHGYLTKAMIEKGVKHVQVVENKIGPLNNAKCNLKDYPNVSFSLSDGLNDLEQDIDTVTICGMGGHNIVKILNDNLAKAKRLKKLILQPNSHVEVVRKYLSDQSFNISDEDLIKEDEHFYHLVIASFEEGALQLNAYEIAYGPILLKKQSPNLTLKYQAIVDCYKEVLKSSVNDFEKKRLIGEIKRICQYINGVHYES